jgi:hypothetical protein
MVSYHIAAWLKVISLNSPEDGFVRRIGSFNLTHYISIHNGDNHFQLPIPSSKTSLQFLRVSFEANGNS